MQAIPAWLGPGGLRGSAPGFACSLPAMTFLELAAAAAGAGVVAAYFGERCGRFSLLLIEDLHDLMRPGSPGAEDPP